MDRKWKLLVVDDDQLIIDSIQLILPDNWSMVGCNKIEDIPNTFFHAAFVDQHLKHPHIPHGLEVIKKLAREHPYMEIVAISGDFDRSLMESCLRAGATRFLAKPLNANEFCLVLEKIEALQMLHQSTRSSSTHNYWFGKSDISNQLKKQIALLKGEPGPVLIEGESGTGKEIVAHLIHNQDGERPFVAVNVAGISENLFESELFGHTKGSFTGADQNKMGLAEAAHSGDLFLDEIEALSLSSQVKLLRFLESGEVRRVGAKESNHIDVRIIVASNQNLETLVKKGTFREDLLFRLNGKKISIPSLRERRSEISDLIQFFLKNQFAKYNKVMGEDALNDFIEYSWPGNIRELKRVLEQLCLFSPLPIIRSEDFQKIVNPIQVKPHDLDLNKGLENLLQEFEKQILVKSLDQNCDIDHVAQILKISRSSLYKKLKDYNIQID